MTAAVHLDGGAGRLNGGRPGARNCKRASREECRRNDGGACHDKFLHLFSLINSDEKADSIKLYENYNAPTIPLY
jgi:hypothetical protein